MRFSPLFFLTDLIGQTEFGEDYSLWSSSLCIFFYFRVDPFLLGENTFLDILFSNTLNQFSPNNYVMTINTTSLYVFY